MTCQTCKKEYTPDCDWRQGRCPHHPPLIDINKLKVYNPKILIRKIFKK